MSRIGATTPVHIIILHNGNRFYLTKVESARNPKTSELYLKGFWNDDASLSQPFAFETACKIRERLQRESGIQVRFAFQAGDSVDLIPN